MTIMLVFGATLAAINTMYASLANRRRQMATLVVLGYKQRAVLLSFWLESIAIAGVGGGLAAAASLFLDGLAMSIPMGVFRFTIEPWMLAGGIGLALFVGVVGALFPLWRLARQDLVGAMRD